MLARLVLRHLILYMKCSWPTASAMTCNLHMETRSHITINLTRISRWPTFLAPHCADSRFHRCRRPRIFNAPRSTSRDSDMKFAFALLSAALSDLDLIGAAPVQEPEPSPCLDGSVQSTPGCSPYVRSFPRTASCHSSPYFCGLPVDLTYLGRCWAYLT